MNTVVGILGLGVRSTNFYANQLHQKMHNYYGDYHTFPFLNYQIDFNRLNPYLPNNFEKLIPNVNIILKEIEKFKVQHWLVPNITLHETLDKVNHNVSLIHPVELAIKNCIENKITSVVILGTNYTMQSEFLSFNFKYAKIEVKSISNNDKELVNNLRIKIYNSEESSLDMENYKNLISKYSLDSHIIIACTELSLLTSNLKNKKILDLAQLQINEAFNTFLKTK